jgi:iron complex outermembrane receptor protein
MIRTFLLLSLLALQAAAQTTVTLTGKVTDEQGGAVPDARIRVYRQDSTARDSATTDSTGRYTMERLMPGNVVFEIERDGFRGVTRLLELPRGSEQRLDVTLAVAGVTQSVLVTATGVAQSVDEISKATSLLTGEDIEARDEYSLAEALRAVPGVLVTNGGGPGQNTSIRIRGVRPDATAILVDGLRFRDGATTQSDASSFISTMNFAGADRVEVLRGSGSSLYGTNAVGGVVNVISQEGGAPLHGQLIAEAGNLGLYRGKGSVGGGVFNNRLRFAGSLLHLNVTRGVDGNDANRSTAGQGFAVFQLTPAMSVSGRVWASDDFVQLNISPTTTGLPAANFPSGSLVQTQVLSPANVRLLNAGLTPNYSGVTLIPGRDDPDSRRGSRFYTSALIFRYAMAPKVNWQASYQRVHTSRIFQNGPAGTGSQPAAENYSNYVGDIDTVDARVTALPASWLSVTGGYEFERENYFDTQNNNLAAPRTVVSATQARQDANAAWFATQLSALGRRLQVSLSGRAQAFRLDRPVFQLTGVANNYDRVPLQAPPDALTGDVAVSYLIARSNTKLRVHAGNSYRAPSLYERFGGGFSANPITGVLSFSPYGDPRLSPDRYNSVDAGVDQYLWQNRIRLSATQFYTRVVAVTAFDSSGAVNTATDPYGRSSGYINGSGGISRGVELGAEVRPTRRLTITGAYTYTNADLDRDLTVQGFWKVFQVPGHVMSVVATQRWARRLDTTLELFHGSMYYNSFYAAGRSRAFQFPGFTKADFVAGYRVWQNEARYVRFHGKVENLLNERYYQNGWLAPRATFVTGLSYGF